MFGSINTDPAYTFTQLGNRQNTNDTLNLLSNYFGGSVVPEKVQIRNSLGEAQKTGEAVKNSGENKTINGDKGSKGEVEELFSADDSEAQNDLIYDGQVSSITTSFDSLAAATGSANSRVTKSQLIALLQNLSSEAAENPDIAKEVSFVKNLIAKFDVLSDGQDYITSFNGVNEAQDYTTITQEQVTPPIDVRI